MSHEAYIIRSSRIVADNRIASGSILIRGEKIERIQLAPEDEHTPPAPIPGNYPELDVGNLLVLPGLVDTHVHVNEPGRTDWEGFTSAGRAAAAGGITTIVVMPLNCTPAATNIAALMGEAEAAASECLVDYGFWGGLVPGNLSALQPMWEAGALGFKAFMVDSGVADFAHVSEHDLDAAFPILARLGAPLLVHAEDPDTLDQARASSKLDRHPRSYAAYLASRPFEAEIEAVRTLVRVARRHPGTSPRLHIVHVSHDRVAFEIAQARPSLNMTAETCPHYFAFNARRIKDGQTQFKCAPPIREGFDTVWECLHDGPLDMIASDHSPCPPELKHSVTGDFSLAWGGISSLQLMLPVVWTFVRKTAYADWHDICRWISEVPAHLAGIGARKGRLAPGLDADLVIFDPDEAWTVRAEALHHRHKLTPYDGMPLRGVVKRTILRGRTIYDAALPNPFPLDPIGQWIKRGTP